MWKWLSSFSLFGTKVYLKAETDTFKVNQLFSANTTKAQNSKFKFLFCPLEYEKPSSNVGWFNKFEELFNTTKLNSKILWGITLQDVNVVFEYFLI